MTEARPAAAEFVVIAPARLGSSRLPRKALADIGGAPMLARVLRQAAKSGAGRVVAAIDDEALLAAAGGFETAMTGEHDCGGARTAEAISRLGLADDAIVVNAQGDEPFIEPSLLAETAALLATRADCDCATACRPARDAAEFADPAAVKIVMGADGTAAYFSRAPIPYPRDGGGGGAPAIGRIHIGVYACRAGYWRRWTAMPPAPTEETERLEQLRIIWHGGRIAVLDSASDSFGVDTAEDLARARRRASGE